MFPTSPVNNDKIDCIANFVWVEVRFNLNRADHDSNGLLQGFWNIRQLDCNRVQSVRRNTSQQRRFGFFPLFGTKKELVFTEPDSMRKLMYMVQRRDISESITCR